jgi:hypothetical protein
MIHPIQLLPGRTLRKYEPRQDSGVVALMCCDAVSRGLAFADGKMRSTQPATAMGLPAGAQKA